MFKGTPYANKIVQKKQEKRSLNYHRSNLRKIKPLTGLPQSAQVVQINNGKKQLQNQLKFTQIERQNRILLEKITSIMNKTKRMTNGDPWQTSRHNKSLNSTFRKKQLSEIQIQNAKLLKRLQEKKPNYEAEKFNSQWRKQKKLKKIMSHYPASLEKRSARNSLNLINHKYSSSQIQPIESYRIKTINNVNFLITIKLNHLSLTITGDTKQSKGLKVIEISREEAIDFIEEQCQGNIELLFDRLRYDHDEEALYLVSKEVTLQDVLNKQKKKQQGDKPQQEEDSNPENNKNLQEQQERKINNVKEQEEESQKQKQLNEQVEQNDQNIEQVHQQKLEQLKEPKQQKAEQQKDKGTKQQQKNQNLTQRKMDNQQEIQIQQKKQEIQEIQENKQTPEIKDETLNMIKQEGSIKNQNKQQENAKQQEKLLQQGDKESAKRQEQKENKQEQELKKDVVQQNNQEKINAEQNQKQNNQKQIDHQEISKQDANEVAKDETNQNKQQ